MSRLRRVLAPLLFLLGALVAAPLASAQPILFIVVDADSDPDVSDDESQAISALHRLGYSVVIRDQDDAAPANWGTPGAYRALMMTASVTADAVDKYRAGSVSGAVPVVSSNPGMYDDWNWTTAAGSTVSQSTVTITNPAHALAAGLSGSPSVYSSSQAMSLALTGTLGAAATVVATDASGNPLLFVYEAGAALPGTDPDPAAPTTAPARYIGFFGNAQYQYMNANGWSLYGAAVQYAGGAAPSTPGALPATLTGATIGGGASGWSLYDSTTGTYVIQGEGNDIWGTSDEFRFAYTATTGDFYSVVRLISDIETDNWAKSGIMARASTAANAMHTTIVGTPRNGIVLQYRASTGGSSTSSSFSSDPNTTMDGSAPVWLSLQRIGDTFYVRWAADAGGVPGTWSSALSTTNASMPASVLLGLAVTSHDDQSMNSALFDHFEIIQPVAVLGGASFGALYGQALSEELISQTISDDLIHWTIQAAPVGDPLQLLAEGWATVGDLVSSAAFPGAVLSQPVWYDVLLTVEACGVTATAAGQYLGIPEPGTLALTALGLLGLARRRRRARRATAA